MERRMIRCRWCPFVVPLWTIGRDRQRRSGWWKLAEHVDDHHRDVDFDALWDEVAGDPYEPAAPEGT